MFLTRPKARHSEGTPEESGLCVEAFSFGRTIRKEKGFDARAGFLVSTLGMTFGGGMGVTIGPAGTHSIPMRALS
jgi:hypothetical protein